MSAQAEDTAKRGLSARERRVLHALEAEERATLAVADVERVLAVPRVIANQVLQRLAGKGWLLRIRRGLYAPVPLGAAATRASAEEPWLVAMAMYTPGYISGWTAAEHWGLSDQIFNTVSVVTAAPQRSTDQLHGGIRFHVRTVPAAPVFGVRSIWLGSSRAQVADPTRMVIEILQATGLGGGIRHTLDIVRNYWRSPHADAELVLDYADRLGVGAVFKRLGFTAERFATPSTEWVERCRRGMSAGVSRLDPTGGAGGKIVSRWRLRVNAPVDDE